MLSPKNTRTIRLFILFKFLSAMLSTLDSLRYVEDLSITDQTASVKSYIEACAFRSKWWLILDKLSRLSKSKACLKKLAKGLFENLQKYLFLIEPFQLLSFCRNMRWINWSTQLTKEAHSGHLPFFRRTIGPLGHIYINLSVKQFKSVFVILSKRIFCLHILKFSN